MRWVAGMAAVVAAVLAAAPAPAGAAERSRVTIALLPVGHGDAAPLIERFASMRGAAVGLTSPTLGRYERLQMLLDMGQGARVARSLYGEDVQRLRVRLSTRGRRGRLTGWGAVVERAHGAPGDVVPGLLGQAVSRGPLVAAYRGFPGAGNQEAAVAADRSGRMTFLSRLFDVDVVGERGGLEVERLSRGEEGLQELRFLFDERRSRETVYVVAEPPSRDGALLVASAMAGPGVQGGVLRSDTTRREGLVSATDVAPTVLRHLGVPVPEEMEGERIVAVAGEAADVVALDRRYRAVKERRGVAGAAIGAAWLLLAAALWLARRRAGLRVAGRVVFLAALWVPALALLTAALRPSAAVEAAILALGGVVVGAVTDRLVRWPAAPAVPAAVGFAAHAVDLAAGSPLIAASLLGPDPRGGARFYGVGNELEIALSLLVVLGLGAALAPAPARATPWAFAAGCLVAALVLGAGRLGADVGAVITLAAAAVGAVVALAPPERRARLLAIGVLIPVLAVAALVALDALTGGGAHLSRSVLGAGETGDLLDVAERRVRLSAAGLASPVVAVLVLVAIAALLWAARRRDALLAPLAGPEGRVPRAALAGGLAATVVGALANDSGPMILLFGAAAVGLALLYAHGRPGWTGVTDAT